MSIEQIPDFKEKFIMYSQTIKELDPQAACEDFFKTYEIKEVVSGEKKDQWDE